jgi:hypothetical protein
VVVLIIDELSTSIWSNLVDFCRQLHGIVSCAVCMPTGRSILEELKQSLHGQIDTGCNEHEVEQWRVHHFLQPVDILLSCDTID